jgi:diacylglycerol kinase
LTLIPVFREIDKQMQAIENDNKNKKFSFIARLKSFRNAFSGLVVLLKYTHNSRIHLFILILVLIAGLILRIALSDWITIFFAAGLVFISECFNTAVEYLSDIISPGYDEKIKRAKDVAAAGVLISAIMSILIGIAVFLPKILKLLN